MSIWNEGPDAGGGQRLLHHEIGSVDAPLIRGLAASYAIPAAPYRRIFAEVAFDNENGGGDNYQFIQAELWRDAPLLIGRALPGSNWYTHMRSAPFADEAEATADSVLAADAAAAVGKWPLGWAFSGGSKGMVLLLDDLAGELSIVRWGGTLNARFSYELTSVAVIGG